MSELKRCPFCGGEAKIDKTIANTVSVECTVCHASSRMILCTEGDIEQKAIEAWNTRKPLERIVERLEYEYHEIDKCKKESYEDGEWERFDMFANLKNGIGRAIVIVKEEGVTHNEKDINSRGTGKL